MKYDAYAFKPSRRAMTPIRPSDIIATDQPISAEELEHLRANATQVAAGSHDEQYSRWDAQLQRHIHIMVYLNR